MVQLSKREGPERSLATRSFNAAFASLDNGDST